MPSSPRVAAATRWKLVQHWQKTCTWMCVQAATHFIPASRRPLIRVVASRNSVSVFPSGRALAANGSHLISIRRRMRRLVCRSDLETRGQKVKEKEARLLFCGLRQRRASRRGLQPSSLRWCFPADLTSTMRLAHFRRGISPRWMSDCSPARVVLSWRRCEA